ncbi:MAG: hypothetical protein RLW68_00325 [Devosia marina]|uniref:hypothetical protein n=1 Tax=Devosia marina TaxID=2683198 RepID=UPI0032EC516B
MQLNEAISLIAGNRKPILFLGAGFANQAINAVGLSTPSSWQLVDRMLSSVDVDGGNNAPLSFAIDQLREQAEPTSAYNFLAGQLTVPDPTLEQRRILALPWHRIYTTNIDNIGIDHSNRNCLDAAVDTAPASHGDFIYLHGCLAKTTPTNYYQRVKMGEQLYVAGSHSTSLYHSLLHQDLHESDCVFVIGYSMGDPDLSALFYGSSPDLVNKCFVFSGTTKPIESHRISFIGTDTKQTSSDFLNAVDAQPVSTAPQYPVQIEPDQGAYDAKAVSQISRQNLLIYGRFDRNIARYSWADPSQPVYAVARRAAHNIASMDGPATVVVHSHLGNGKSIALEFARFAAASSGKAVFSIDRTVDTAQLRELLEALPVASIVFFEGDVFSASNVQDVVASRSLVLCVTSRTTTFRVASRALYSNAKSAVRLFDVNRLEEDDLEQFSALIDSMGFWPPELQGKSPEDRRHALRTKYDYSICSIILGIFENETIKREVSQIWNASYANLRPHLDHFILASYMDMIDVDAPPYIIKAFQSFDFRRGETLVNEIVSLSHTGVLAFSNSIIGEFVLQRMIEKEAIIGAVVRFSNFMDQSAYQARYQWVVRRLLRYWNLSRLLDSRTLPEEVFDRASYIPSIAGDPLFWVQYSIAKMENGEYLPARRFVDTAYGKAREKGNGFDTYQIDTHAARLVIRSIVDNGIYEGFALDLNKAVAALRAVVERRGDDIYHASSVVTLLLTSNISWHYEMSEREFGTLRTNLIAIGNKISEHSGNGDYSFAPERQAADLIDRLR